MSVNKVILLGRLGQDPETKDVNGTMLCKFSVATSQKWKDKQGEQQEKTEWHNIDAWGKVGEVIAEYFHKGSEIYLEGELNYSKVDEKYYTNIKLTSFSFTGGSRQDSESPQPKDNSKSEDLPF